MKSIDSIFRIMEANGAANWKLRALEDRKWQSCGTFSAEKKADDMGASQERLQQVVGLHDDGDTVFEIELMLTPSSHGAGCFGPYKFTVSGDEPQARNQRDNRQQGNLGGLGQMLPNGFQDLLQLDRSHGTLQMQQAALQQERQAIEKERQALRDLRAELREDAKEKAAEYKAAALADAQREIAHERQKFDFEKLQFQAQKDQYELIQQERDGYFGKFKDVLGFVTDVVHAKLTGKPTDASLSGTEQEDPMWQACEGLAQELYKHNDPHLINTVIEFYTKLVTTKNAKNGTNPPNA